MWARRGREINVEPRLSIHLTILEIVRKGSRTREVAGKLPTIGDDGEI